MMNLSLWNENLAKLSEYKKIFGDCNVPKDHVDYVGLSRWVRRQREDYKKSKSGEKSPMTTDREEALNAIGFQWEIWKSKKGAK